VVHIVAVAGIKNHTSYSASSVNV